MTQSPNPLDKKTLSRTSVAGFMLAALGIALFMVLWVMLGNAGVENFPRLILSLCLPPAVIAAVIGIYVLFIRPGSPPG